MSQQPVPLVPAGKSFIAPRGRPWQAKLSRRRPQHTRPLQKPFRRYLAFTCLNFGRSRICTSGNISECMTLDLRDPFGTGLSPYWVTEGKWIVRELITHESCTTLDPYRNYLSIVSIVRWSRTRGTALTRSADHPRIRSPDQTVCMSPCCLLPKHEPTVPHSFNLSEPGLFPARAVSVPRCARTGLLQRQLWSAIDLAYSSFAQPQRCCSPPRNSSST